VGTDLSTPEAGAVPALPPVFGRYRVEGLLGRGGMGAVYRAHDTQLDRPVALKVPNLADGDRARPVERFLREARAAARLQHPNICPVFEAGEIGGTVYLSMALVDGQPLAQRLRGGPLPPAEAAALVRTVALAMAEAHRAGVVHRDLKPANVLLNARGEPVVMDFGLARDARFRGEERLTRDGALVGTPAYLPPEQVGGEEAGPAGDIYSLGVVLYECLTGRVPFRAASLGELVAQIERDPPPPPSGLRPGLPAWLEAVCLRALAKRPGDRFPSMEAFAVALAPFATGSPAPSPPGETTEFRPPRRRRGPLVAAGAALLAAALGAILYVVTDRGTVEVRVVPAADVRVEVDGQEVTLTNGGAVMRVRAGEHGLEVTGKDFETHSDRFRVKRGETTVVEVPLRPKGRAGGGAGQAAARERLAALLRRGREHARAGRYQEAGRVAEEALRLDPQSPGALAMRAHAAAVGGRRGAAATDAAAALRLNPDEAFAYYVRAMLAYDEGRLDAAIADLTVFLRLSRAEGRETAYNNRGWAYFRKGEYHQAVADTTEALKHDRDLALAYAHRGAALVHLGDYEKALADYDECVKRAPASPRWYGFRSAVRARLGDLPKAKADMEMAVKFGAPADASPPALPDPPRPVARKTLTAAEQAELDRALAELGRATDGNQHEQAVRAVDRALRVEPTNFRALAHRAFALAGLRRLDEALRDANEAVRLGPQSAVAYTARGSVHSQRGQLVAAVADHTVAVRLSPSNHFAWNNRGYAYLRLGVYGQAVADETEALTRAPGYVLALANRGDAYICLGEYAKALADFVAAEKYDPSNPKWPEIQSVLYAKLGEFAKAKAARENAIQLDEKVRDRRPPTLPAPPPPPHRDPELPAR
jgi:tetratricopeptide (TPR) repeat protein